MVNGLTGHPPADAVRAFGYGLLDPAAADVLADHLGDCDTCCRLLADTPADPFVDRLRRARPAHGPDAHATATSGDTNPAPDDELPLELEGHPRYRVLRELGRGGMGAVYLAEHRRMDRPVALKVISPTLLHGPDLLNRFRQEVRAAARLIHPNIVTAFDADQAGDLHFLVMEYVEGETLADRLRDGCPLAPADACAFARQAALGLQHAHDKGMVHRDVKPHNLMLTPDGTVKILDFGLARFARQLDPAASRAGSVKGHPSPDVTGTGVAIGTPAYMAPEQARGETVDHRADLFSLGCTLYQMLTGRRPFTGPDTKAVLTRLATDTPPAPRDVNRLLPAALSDLTMRLLEKDPSRRPPTARAVAESLADIGFRLAPTVTPLVEDEKQPADPWTGIDDPGPAAMPAAQRVRSRRQWPLIAGLALFVVCLVVSGIVILPAGKDRELVIETDDPTIEVVVKGDRIVRIVDPVSKKEYRLDRQDLTLALADGTDGLQVALDDKAVVLKRKGERIATVRLARTNDPLVKAAAPAPVRPAAGVPVTGPDEPMFAPLATFSGHRQPWVCHPTTSPDGKLAATFACSKDGSDRVRVWEIETAREVAALDIGGDRVGGLAFRADGGLLVSGEKALTIWKPGQWEKPERTLKGPKEGGDGFGPFAGFSPDRRWAVAADEMDCSLRLWDLDRGVAVQSWKGHAGEIKSIAVSPDGSRAVTCGFDRTVRVWDTKDGIELKRLHAFGPASPVEYAPDGRRFAWHGAQGEVYLCDPDGWVIRRLKYQSPSVGRAIRSLTFTPDGNRLLASEEAGEGSGLLWVWDLRTGNAIAEAVRQPLNLAVTADGKKIVTTHYDGTARVWRLSVVVPSVVGDSRMTDYREIHGADLAGLKAWVASLPAGFRPSHVGARQGSTMLLFDAVAVAEADRPGWQVGYPAWDGRNPHWKEMTAAGFRFGPACLYMSAGVRGEVYGWVKDGRYFRSNDGPPALIEERLREGRLDGCRPEALTGMRTETGELLIDLTMRRAPGAWDARLDLGIDELVKEVEDCRKKGWRPDLVSVYHNREPARYLAVFAEVDPAVSWDFQAGLTQAEYEAALTARRAQQFRPKSVASYAAAGQVRFAVVWEGWQPGEPAEAGPAPRLVPSPPG